jgi:hypothetical protein
MNDKLIEARLERSLRNQVRAPRLGQRFDAAVWARIEAQSMRAPAPVAKSARVMFVINGIGIGVAFLLLAVFGLPSLSGVDATVTLPAVAVPEAAWEQGMKIGAQVISFAAIGFGLMFTATGRRLRQELRGFF